MKKLVLGAVVLAAIVAGGVYFARDPAGPAQSDGSAAPRAGDDAAAPASAQQGTSRSKVDIVANPAPDDPRLAALRVSPDNGLIEFVAAAGGKVIQEIDNDPNSLGYRKPTREYRYSGDKVVGLTAYRYLGDRVEITRTAVSYKPDGSVDQLREETSYEFGKKK